MNKVLYLRNLNSSWIIQDREILKEKFKVTDYYCNGAFSSLKYFHLVIQNDIVFAWFASFDFLPIIMFARLLGKRIYIVGGGYDITSVPQLGYGAFFSGFISRWLRRKLLLAADKVLGVSKVSFIEAYFFAGLPANKIDFVDLGFDFDMHLKDILPWEKRKNQVITISSANEDGFFRKGVFKFIQVAALMPDTDFIVIGKVAPEMKAFIEANFHSNIKFTGFVSDREMVKLMQDSKVALQLSLHESFGASVIEAAILGSYPMVSSEYSLPEVADGPGTRLSHNHYDDICSRIRDVFNSQQDSESISKYYREKYPLRKRKEKLLEIVK